MHRHRHSYMAGAGERASDPRDRRAEPRYSTVESVCRIGWWCGEEFHHAAACILDISQGGMQIQVEDVPDEGSTVFLCLHGPISMDWLEARVVCVARAEARSKRAARIRLALAAPCPYEVFKLAVYGRGDPRRERKMGSAPRRGHGAGA